MAHRIAPNDPARILRGQIEEYRELIRDMVVYDRASNHPQARAVWAKARAVHDAVEKRDA